MQVKKIEELDEVTELAEGMFLPVATSTGVKKMTPETARSGLVQFVTGAGAPAGNPTAAGIFYVNTETDDVYFSTKAGEDGWKEISVNDEV